MGTISLKGNPVETSGQLPPVGSHAPAFTLTRVDLSDVSLSDFKGKRVVLNIFPSVDTGVCAASVRRFNQEATQLADTAVLCVSADLPFALKRFCGAEGLDHVIPASSFRSPDFGGDYGITLVSGPLRGLLSRAVVVVDKLGQVIYTQQVPEIATEPDYTAALKTLG